MIAKIELTKLGRNCAIAITEIGTTITQTYVEDSGNIEMCYNQSNNTVTVTIFGNTSATTPVITTGTYLTIDSGSGAVTITSYATFKTNYALLFLSGGSVPPIIPTLDQILYSGYIATTQPIINLILGNETMNLNSSNFIQSTIIEEFNNAISVSSDSINFSKFLIEGNIKIYESRIIPNTANTGVTIINYLPENSGTLLNGQFVNDLGLEINYDAQSFILGKNSTGERLSIELATKDYNFSDGISGIIFNLSTHHYNYGLNENNGLNIDAIGNIYKLGNPNNYFQIDGGSNTTTLKTEAIVLDGGNLIGGLGTLTGTSLLITINNNQYKINLAT